MTTRGADQDPKDWGMRTQDALTEYSAHTTRCKADSQLVLLGTKVSRLTFLSLLSCSSLPILGRSNSNKCGSTHTYVQLHAEMIYR